MLTGDVRNPVGPLGTAVGEPATGEPTVYVQLDDIN